MTIDELRDIIAENFMQIDSCGESVIDISGLDFSKYKCSVDISHMRVN